MTDPTTRAAACLRDDPTFARSPRSEQEAEASEALAREGGDPTDPLELALTIEAALAPAPLPTPEDVAKVAKSTPVATQRAIILDRKGKPPPLPPLEPCREGKEPCSPRVSATGRCMDCGAIRTAPERPVVVVTDVEPYEHEERGPPKAPKEPKGIGGPPPTFSNLLLQAKLLTRWPDHVFAEILKLSRPTVQAYVGGRLAERLTRKQTRALRDSLDSASRELAALVARIDKLSS